LKESGVEDLLNMIHKAQVVSAEVKAAKAEGRQYVYEES
jgi:hypothetical protein